MTSTFFAHLRSRCPAGLALLLALAFANAPGAAMGEDTAGTATAEPVTIERAASGEVVRNPDGSVTSTAAKTWTGPNGAEVQAERTGTVVRDGNGYARDAQTRITNSQTGETKSFDTTGSGSRTVNEDGSTSYERSRTTVNEQTGATRTIENQATVTKTESGATISHDRTATGPNGGTVEKSTTGSVNKAEDGTRTFQSSTNGTATGPNGAQRTWTTDRAGSSTPNNQGGRDRSSTATTTLDNSKVSSVERSGSTWRDGQGNAGFERRADRVGPNGGLRTVEQSGASARTADGRAWTRHGTVTHQRAGAGARR